MTPEKKISEKCGVRSAKKELCCIFAQHCLNIKKWQRLVEKKL